MRRGRRGIEREKMQQIWLSRSWQAEHDGLLTITDFRQLLSEGDRFTVRTNEVVTMDYRHTPEVGTIGLLTVGFILSRKVRK